MDDIIKQLCRQLQRLAKRYDDIVVSDISEIEAELLMQEITDKMLVIQHQLTTIEGTD